MSNVKHFKVLDWGTESYARDAENTRVTVRVSEEALEDHDETAALAVANEKYATGAFVDHGLYREVTITTAECAGTHGRRALATKGVGW